MNRHLTLAEIEQYINRSGGVDEIIAIAEHLEACFHCRDRAVAIVDPGSSPQQQSEVTKFGVGRWSLTTGVVVIWIAVIMVVSAILVFAFKR